MNQSPSILCAYAAADERAAHAAALVLKAGHAPCWARVVARQVFARSLAAARLTPNR